MTAVAIVLGAFWCFVSAETAAEIAVDRGRSKWAWALIGLLFPLGGPLLVWLQPARGPGASGP